jgi:hypothetical protein
MSAIDVGLLVELSSPIRGDRVSAIVAPWCGVARRNKADICGINDPNPELWLQSTTAFLITSLPILWPTRIIGT